MQCKEIDFTKKEIKGDDSCILSQPTKKRKDIGYRFQDYSKFSLNFSDPRMLDRSTIEIRMDAKYVGLTEEEKLFVAAQSALITECEILLTRKPNTIDEINKTTTLYEVIKERLTNQQNQKCYDQIIYLLIVNGANISTPCRMQDGSTETIEQLIERLAQNDDEKNIVSNLLQNHNTSLSL